MAWKSDRFPPEDRKVLVGLREDDILLLFLSLIVIVWNLNCQHLYLNFFVLFYVHENLCFWNITLL